MAVDTLLNNVVELTQGGSIANQVAPIVVPARARTMTGVATGADHLAFSTGSALKSLDQRTTGLVTDSPSVSIEMVVELSPIWVSTSLVAAGWMWNLSCADVGVLRLTLGYPQAYISYDFSVPTTGRTYISMRLVRNASFGSGVDVHLVIQPESGTRRTMSRTFQMGSSIMLLFGTGSEGGRPSDVSVGTAPYDQLSVAPAGEASASVVVLSGGYPSLSSAAQASYQEGYGQYVGVPFASPNDPRNVNDPNYWRTMGAQLYVDGVPVGSPVTATLTGIAVNSMTEHQAATILFQALAAQIPGATVSSGTVAGTPYTLINSLTGQPYSFTPYFDTVTISFPAFTAPGQQWVVRRRRNSGADSPVTTWALMATTSSSPPYMTVIDGAYGAADGESPVVRLTVNKLGTGSYQMQYGSGRYALSDISIGGALHQQLMTDWAGVATVAATLVNANTTLFTFAYADRFKLGYTLTAAVYSQNAFSSAITKLYALRITESDRAADDGFPALPWPTTGIPPSGIGSGTGDAIWDAAFNANDTITNSGRTVSSTTSTNGITRTDVGKTAGVWYFEVDLSDQAGTGRNVGIAGILDKSVLPSQALSGSSMFIGWYAESGSIYTGGAVLGTLACTAPKIVGVEFNAGTRQVRFYTTSGVSQWFSIPGTQAIYGWFSTAGDNILSKGTINAGQAAFVYGLPATARPLSNKADVSGAGYNDIEDLACFSDGNTQATAPDAYGTSAVSLDDFVNDVVAYVDAPGATGTSSQTLVDFTNTGSGLAAEPTNMSGAGALDDFTSIADGVASTPTSFTADYALDDFTSLAVGLFLARIDGSGDGMLEDAFIEDFAIDITTPVVAQLNADVPAATLNAEVSQYEGFKLSAKVPGAALASWFGMRFEKDVPRVAIQATGTIPNILRLDKTLPRVTIGANILDGRNFGLNADVPIASLSAWTGWMMGGVVPAALSSGSIVVGGAYQFNSTVPMSTCFGRVSTMNVLALAASVPAASRANWLAMSRAAPAANLVASVSLVQPVTRLAYSFTLANSAMSRYPAYPFIQIIRMGNAYFGVAEDGLYEIGGDADNGAAIPWAWETCMTDFGKAEKKTVVSAYLGGYVPLVMAYTIKSGDAPTSVNAHTTTATAVLRNHRQKFGIGRKSRFFAFGLSATQGKVAIESVEFEVANMSRRV